MLSFWIYFFVSLFIFVFSFCIGNYLVKTPPKDMYQLFGYRTELSVRNQDTWDFAQVNSGRVCRIVSVTAFILALVLIIKFKTANGRLVFNLCSILVLAAQLLSLSVTFPVTEYLIFRNFHEDGTRKTVSRKNNLMRQPRTGDGSDKPAIFEKISAMSAEIVQKAHTAVKSLPASDKPADNSVHGEQEAGKDENEKQREEETGSGSESDKDTQQDSQP
ncbi:MAG: SdpI family protein [Oscillospiraceae bacterium]|nr:SdpI family protein [Oscillospiraceae bacterium]